MFRITDSGYESSMLREAVRQSPPTADAYGSENPQRTVRGEQQVTAVLIEGIVKTPVTTVVGIRLQVE